MLRRCMEPHTRREILGTWVKGEEPCIQGSGLITTTFTVQPIRASSGFRTDTFGGRDIRASTGLRISLSGDRGNPDDSGQRMVTSTGLTRKFLGRRGRTSA